MKKSIVIILLVISINQLYAQNFVTDPKDFVTGHFDSLGVSYKISTNTEGLEYLYFQDGVFEIQYVFNKIDYCVYYKMIFPEGGFDPMIKSLNDSFEQISENQWKEFDGREYFIWSTEVKNDSCFITVQTQIAFDLDQRGK